MIIGLTASAMMLQHQSAEEVFPKSHSPCPDGWKQHTDGKCYYKYTNDATNTIFDSSFTSSNVSSTIGDMISSMPTGIVNTDIFENSKQADGSYSSPVAVDTGSTINTANYGHITFHPNATRCQKKEWANHHGIKWDGITNYNNCK